jgi:hypothetical protein
MSVLGDGSGPSPYAGALQMTPPFSKPSDMRPSPLPVPVGVDISLLPPPGSPRDYSGADTQNAQNLIYATQTLFHEPPGFSPEPCFSPRFSDPISQAHGGPFSFDDPFPISTSPDSTDDSVNSMPSGPPAPSSITPGSTPLSHVPDHHQSLRLSQASSSSSTSSSSSRPERTPRRRRSEPPRDQRATTRLFDQRKSDDENTEALYKLFVPPGAEVKWKKDRLGISAALPVYCE